MKMCGSSSQRPCSLHRLGRLTPEGSSWVTWLHLFVLLLSSLTASAQSIINTVAGSGRSLSGLGGPATAVALADPYFLALDTAGNLYVSHRIYNTVARITPGDILTHFT